MFNWYGNLNDGERKTFYACFLGWATDAFDAQLFSFLIPTLIGLWAITTAQAGWLGTSALISSAIGGWIAGILCDRFGRVPVMKPRSSGSPSSPSPAASPTRPSSS